jgi:hypothetical protein
VLSTSFYQLDILHKCLKNIAYHKKLLVKNGLSDDEYMTFETCRRHQELN